VDSVVQEILNEIEIRRLSHSTSFNSHRPEPTSLTHITVSGSNARVNISSTDNSTNNVLTDEDHRKKQRHLARSSKKTAGFEERRSGVLQCVNTSRDLRPLESSELKKSWHTCVKCCLMKRDI